MARQRSHSIAFKRQVAQLDDAPVRFCIDRKPQACVWLKSAMRSMGHHLRSLSTVALDRFFLANL
jgi:hypothetical protein